MDRDRLSQNPLESEETMAVRTSSAEWKGTLKEGAGTMKVGGGAYEGPYTHASRFETGPGTNPEELIGAAHAGCYSMFLSALLTEAGFLPIGADGAAFSRHKAEDTAKWGAIIRQRGIRIS